MLTCLTIDEIRHFSREVRLDGQKTLGFVPTMGALHEGHISLALEARKHCDVVIASIFVNPKQFGPSEDFARYPRTISEDIEVLKHAQVDAVFLPNAAEIYPENFQTEVRNNHMAAQLCGAHRPGHFAGVLTVVAKLIHIVQPHHCFFGKKDYQQLTLISTMVRDLCIPTAIHGCETIRDEKGLALSSRNRYLTPEEKSIAHELYAGLKLVSQQVKTGDKKIPALKESFANYLSKFPTVQVEYFEICEQETLKILDQQFTEKVVALAAVRIGKTRLIDNLEISAHGN